MTSPNMKYYQKYEDNKTYPILVPINGRSGNNCRIVEMEGSKVNAWNEMVRRDDRRTNHERHCPTCQCQG